MSPRSDVAVLLTCFTLTVVFDMTVSVTAGVLMAALLFMRRMAEVSGVELVGEGHPALEQPLPRGVVLYDIAGPLFFGAAQKAMRSLQAMEGATCGSSSSTWSTSPPSTRPGSWPSNRS